MKAIVTSLLIIVFFNAKAVTTDQEIRKTCLQHAVSLVNQLKSNIFTDMDKTQSNAVLQMATKDCNKYFNTGKPNQTIVNNTPENSDTMTSDGTNESDDWLTKHILRGEVADKEGNQRLKRLQHK